MGKNLLIYVCCAQRSKEPTLSMLMAKVVGLRSPNSQNTHWEELFRNTCHKEHIIKMKVSRNSSGKGETSRNIYQKDATQPEEHSSE
jgi:hypothetical protein